ncbi:mannan-binding lectin [Sorangium sp. So ce429]
MKKFYRPLAALAGTAALVLGISASSMARTPPATEGVDIPAGPIWNHEDAKVKCPVACAAASLQWNGHWTTVISGRQSVCGCQ